MTHDNTQPSDEQIEQSELFNLERAIDSLVEALRQYESDTFSASATGGIDGETAERMAAYLIHTQLFDPYGIPGESIDGETVGLAYESVIEADSGCDFCRQPIALGEGTYFQTYRGDDLWIHAQCLPQAQERNSQIEEEETSWLVECFTEDAAAAEEENRRQNRKYNSLWYRIATGWRTVSYLIRVRYCFDDLKDLEFLANCVLRQNLEYYRIPEWLAPRRLTDQQRQLMIIEADRAAEGSLTEEELAEMDDRELASAYLGALHDYCVSQGFF